MLQQLQQIFAALNTIYAHSLYNWQFILSVTLGIGILQCLNMLIGYRLNALGVLPRTSHGIWGIFFCHFLHANWRHYFFNAFPLFVLGTLLLTYGQALFIQISLLLMIMSGTLIWLFGRRAIHIGSSALVMGYWGLILSHAYQTRSAVSIVLAGLCLLYFSGFLFSMLPQKKTSWEGHLFGVISGVVVSLLLK